MNKPDKWKKHSSTSAKVDISTSNNGTWSDAFQFGDSDDTSWTLTDMEFALDIQRDPYDVQPALSCSTTNGRILVDDVVQRVIHMDVSAADLQANITPGTYVYDLVMVNTNGVRTPLMHGEFTLVQGVTYPPIG